MNFNYANVAGKVAVDNDSADAAAANGTQQTQVTVNNSHLGTQTLPGDSGNSLLVKNGIGWDQFTMSASTAPWGTSINNDVGGLEHPPGAATHRSPAARSAVVRLAPTRLSPVACPAMLSSSKAIPATTPSPCRLRRLAAISI